MTSRDGSAEGWEEFRQSSRRRGTITSRSELESCTTAELDGGLQSDFYLPLESFLNQRLILLARDGRSYIGYLRTFDQFGNIALEQAYERIVVEGGGYSDLDLGCLALRGENIALVGSADDGHDSPNYDTNLTRRPLCEVLKDQRLGAPARRYGPDSHELSVLGLDFFDDVFADP